MDDPNRLEMFDVKDIEQAVPDVFLLKVLTANVCFIGEPNKHNPDWVLIDAGIPDQHEVIVKTAHHRFGSHAPRAIILTHGHFDHVGALNELLSKWDVPVYAHELETPYLTGQKSYPKPDPTVGGGLMSALSPLYPNGPIRVGDHLKTLPQEGSVPFMPGWRWIHTPGHTKGHIALFRDSDRVLIAGDAFVTVKQESAWAVLTQELEIHRPPAYFTSDWEAAGESVRKLAALEPRAAFTGHGMPIAGKALTEGLVSLAHDFNEIAIPDHGRYVDDNHHSAGELHP